MSTANKYLLLACVITLLAIPFAFIAKSRATASTTPRLQIVLDLDKQPHYKAQRANPFFADDRAMRPHIAHTIAREDIVLQEPANYQIDPNDPAMRHIVLNNGHTWDEVMLGQRMGRGPGPAKPLPKGQTKPPAGPHPQWLKTIPIRVTRAVMDRGQQRFVIYCAPCHGRDGYGDGTVQRLVTHLREEGDPNAGTWVAPANLHAKLIRALPVGKIYNIATNGFAAMAGYKDQVPVADRWAIVAYVRALQASGRPIKIDKAPRRVRAELEQFHGIIGLK